MGIGGCGLLPTELKPLRRAQRGSSARLRSRAGGPSAPVIWNGYGTRLRSRAGRGAAERAGDGAPAAVGPSRPPQLPRPATKSPSRSRPSASSSRPAA